MPKKPSACTVNTLGASDAVALANWMAHQHKQSAQDLRPEDPMTTRILELWSDETLEAWCPTGKKQDSRLHYPS